MNYIFYDLRTFNIERLLYIYEFELHSNLSNLKRKRKLETLKTQISDLETKKKKLQQVKNESSNCRKDTVNYYFCYLPIFITNIKCNY